MMRTGLQRIRNLTQEKMQKIILLASFSGILMTSVQCPDYGMGSEDEKTAEDEHDFSL